MTLKLLITEGCFKPSMLERELKRDYEPIAAADGTQLLTIVENSHDPFLVVIGWSLSDMSGLEAVRRLRTKAHKFYTYVLVIVPVEMSPRLSARDAIAAGADDCVSAQGDEHELIVRLRAGKRIVERDFQRG